MPSPSYGILVATLIAAPLAAQQLGPIERARLAAGIWAEARYNAPAWEGVRSKWDSAFADLLAAAMARESVRTPQRHSDLAYYRRLRRFVALLSDGQAAIEPPAALGARVARPPMVLRSVERRPFLVDYVENDEMRVARPQRNAEIVAVQGVPVDQWIRDSVLPEVAAATVASRWDRAVARMLEGDKGTAVHLQLRLPGGEQRGASVTRSVSLTDRWPLTAPALHVDTLPDRIIWVRVTSFGDRDVARALDRAFADFTGVRGLILDLRDNDGADGGRETGYAMLGRLVARPLVTSRWRTPQYRPAYRGQDMPDSTGAWLSAPPDSIPPRRDLPAFAGPLAVLASSRTGGAAEAVLIAFRNSGRGPILGDVSAGSPGQVGQFPVYRDWRLRLTVTRDAFPDGTEIQGLGVAPEIPVEERVADLLAGRDAALERARQYVAGALKPHSP
ncbi:MAG: S41 family peptidase [Gemmatimonadales bacterium]